jgi:coenzyme F420-reducing hydrogenase delta subunit/ferredoxin
VDADAIISFSSDLPGVVHAEATDDLCGRGHAALAANLVTRHALDRLVVAACACCSNDQRCPACNDERAGLRDAVLAATDLPWAHIDFVNVRNHAATVEDARTMVAMAVARLREAPVRIPPRLKVQPIQAGLVIGAGGLGTRTALELAARGFTTHLLDRSTPTGYAEDAPEGVVLHTPAEVVRLEGGPGRFRVTLSKLGGMEEVEVGTVVIAPGHAEEQEKKGIGWGLTHKSMRSPPQRVRGMFLAARDGVAAAGAAGAFLERHLEGLEHAAVVDTDACIGCLRCQTVCPYSAVAKVPRAFDAGRFSYDGHVIEVSPILCTGCGACASACLNWAVDLPGYTTRQIEAQLEAAIARTPLVAFVCNWSAYRAYDRVASEGVLPAGLVAIRLPCLSRVSPHLVRTALDAGTEQLFLVGCREDGCHYRGRRGVLDDNLGRMAAGLDVQGDLGRVTAIWIGAADREVLLARMADALETRRVEVELEEEAAAEAATRGWSD